jgi:hypothetical protein
MFNRLQLNNLSVHIVAFNHLKFLFFLAKSNTENEISPNYIHLNKLKRSNNAFKKKLPIDSYLA